MKTSRKISFTLITAVLTAAFIDVFSFLAGLYILRDPLNRIHLYKKFLDTPSNISDYKNYLKIRHPLLGWPSPNKFGGKKFDKTGVRRSPAFTHIKQNKPCISLYGDSFTYADEVAHEYAWGNVLSMLRNCRVHNFGVGGYGTDQAYLRYLDTNDKSPIVILGIYDENIKRNVNQFRNFYLPITYLQFGFKPRFILEGDKLRLIPLPEIDPKKLRDFSRNPKKYLKYDFFVPDGNLNTQFKFPYSISLIEAVLKTIRSTKNHSFNNHIHSFYSKNHISDSFEVTVGIVQEFRNTALRKSQIPIVLFIPGNNELKQFQKTQQWGYQPLLDELSKIEHLQLLNSGTKFIKYLDNRSPNILFIDQVTGGGHFNETGYKILAERVNEYLLENGHVKSHIPQVGTSLDSIVRK